MIPSPDGASGGVLDPAGYLELLEELTSRVRATQVRAARAANTEVLALCWSIGRDVLVRQGQGGWGAKVVERLAGDLRAVFPDQRGWSRRNLRYMRAMVATWPVAGVEELVQQPAARLPWGHVTVLLTRLGESTTRDWCAVRAVEHGWSRAVTSTRSWEPRTPAPGRRPRASPPTCPPPTPSAPARGGWSRR